MSAPIPPKRRLEKLGITLTPLLPWFSRLCVAAVMLPVIGISLAAAFPTLLSTAKHRLSEPNAWLAFFLVLGVVACCGWLSRRARPLPVAWFLIGATLLSATIRVAYSLIVVPEWTSDFLTYWTTALSQVESGNFKADSFYTERTLPVLVPLTAIFGDIPYSVKAANIAMLGLAQLAGYDLLRRLRSHQAAQAFTIGFAAAPIPLFALTIPSHDLWALFFLAVAVWLCAVLLTSTTRHRRLLLAATVVALSLACLLMQVQRGVGTLLALALVISSALGWAIAAGKFDEIKRARASTLLLASVLVLAAQFPLGAMISTMGLRAADSPGQKTHMTAYYATHGTSLGNGTWGWMRGFQEQYTDELRDEPERLQALSRSLVLSDWSEQPVKRVENVYRRLAGMYFLDNSNFWYFANLNQEGKRYEAWLNAYSIWFSTAFSLLMLVSLVRLLRGTDPTSPTFTCMVFIAMVSLALASFSENQPRYIMWLWFGGMLWLSEMFTPRRSASRLSVVQAIGMATASLAAWGVLLSAIWGVTALSYQPDSGRILGDWADKATGDLTGNLPVATPSDPYVHATQPGELSVAVGANAAPAVEHRVCLEGGGPRDLTFFLHATEASPGDVLLVSYGAQPLHRVPLASKVTDIRLPSMLQGTGCHILRLEVDGSETTQAIIDFPRLEN